MNIKTSTLSYANPNDLLKQLQSKRFQLIEPARHLIFPLISERVARDDEAGTYEILSDLYIRNLAKKYSRPDFKIEYLSMTDYKLIFNELGFVSEMEIKRYKKADLILWPMSFDGHAYLIIIEKRSDQLYRISGIDSGNSYYYSSRLLEKAKKLMNDLLKDVEVEAGHYEVPLQSNDYDCGIAQAYYAKALCCQIDLTIYFDVPYKHCNYSLFRLEIADVIASLPENELEKINRLHIKKMSL